MFLSFSQKLFMIVWKKMAIILSSSEDIVHLEELITMLIKAWLMLKMQAYKQKFICSLAEGKVQLHKLMKWLLEFIHLFIVKFGLMLRLIPALDAHGLVMMLLATANLFKNWSRESNLMEKLLQSMAQQSCGKISSEVEEHAHQLVDSNYGMPIMIILLASATILNLEDGRNLIWNNIKETWMYVEQE